MEYAKDIRKHKNRLFELAEDGVISWEEIARMALNYMSEDEVEDMARGTFEYLEDEDEEED